MDMFFDGEAKGEILALRDKLDGNDPSERKIAAKRVIGLMRAGENVHSLFSSMLRCVKTTDLELKKLTYLYLVNYSSQEPEQAIMAVNTFIQDSQDSNPLVRALAVRTMCRIKLESVAENMIIPLKKSLSDSDPYVRKTAAFGVAKLYDIIPEAVENSDLFSDLLSLFNDENPMVVSNTVASIMEINERRTTPIFVVNSKTIAPLLSAIPSCTEWCQSILLDSISKYVPENHEDAQFLIERLTILLKNANPAVVLGAFKCIFLFMESDMRNPVEIFPTIIPPLITLSQQGDPEVQYSVLRTFSLFVMKYPRALGKEIRVFFVKYNDQSYIKLEKLDIIVNSINSINANLVLEELSEYCNSVDVGFVRKTIRCIGQIAIKMEATVRRCVDILMVNFQGKADYAIEESVIVFCDLLRKFPGIFENIIAVVVSTFELIKEPRAKSAAIWLLGEYCKIIDHVDLLLDPFLDTFHDEDPLVQLQILTSLVKIYIYQPETSKDQLQFVLSEATKDTNVPDVKNRALLYWRLLSAEGTVAKDICLFDKTTIMDSTIKYHTDVLNELIANMGSVSGVLHIIPSDFVRRIKYVPDDDETDYVVETLRDWRPLKLNDTFIELFIDFDKTHLYLRIVNNSPTQISKFAFALNKNIIGLGIADLPTFPQSLDFAEVAEVTVNTKLSQAQIGNQDKVELQLALQTSLGTVFTTARVPLQYYIFDNGRITMQAFNESFNNYQSKIEFSVEDCLILDEAILTDRNIFLVGKMDGTVCISFSLSPEAKFVAKLKQELQTVTGIVKGNSMSFLPLIESCVQYLFTTK